MVGFLTVLTLFGTTPVFALEKNSNATVIEEFGDGSYIEVTIEELPQLTKSESKKGSKMAAYKNQYGEILWSVKVTGTFTYDGSTAKCTAASVSTQCPAINWKLSNIRSSKSGASAYGYATAKSYNGLGMVLQTINEVVKLTCSPSGALS